MKELRPKCRACRHEFHAEGPCNGYNRAVGLRCTCKGAWFDETKAISGFCYVLAGTSLDSERASHASCPGNDYPYPCECDCHGGVKSR